MIMMGINLGEDVDNRWDEGVPLPSRIAVGPIAQATLA
jgi:hypothetical protein